MTRDELIDRVAANVVELSDALHTAVNRGKSGEAMDYGRALEGTCAALRELADEDD